MHRVAGAGSALNVVFFVKLCLDLTVIAVWET